MLRAAAARSIPSDAARAAAVRAGRGGRKGRRGEADRETRTKGDREKEVEGARA